MKLEQILVALAAFASTVIGGLLTLRFKDRISLLMGFTGGVLLGVAALEILPEIMELVEQGHFAAIEPMVALVVGFLLFHTIEKLVLIHSSHEKEYAAHKHPHIGILSALALSGHSFMDGVGIGLGFQVDSKLGVIVAIAVISHDFADGLNTTGLMLVNNNSIKRSLILLLLDALAPVVGVLSTFAFNFPMQFQILYLGFFAGFLFYIAGSDILPQAHSPKPSGQALLLSYAGVIFIFVVTRFI